MATAAAFLLVAMLAGYRFAASTLSADHFTFEMDVPDEQV
jgi:hypothetical protein